MKLKLTILLFAIAFIATQAVAQKTLPWKKRLKIAENYELNGDYYQAAVYYEGVYKEKSDKEEIIYKAGNCYYLLRDYANAVKCLDKVKDKNDLYDKPGYKYASALKQTGKHEDAKKAFSTFIGQYDGADKEAMKKAVDVQIQGCDFALNAKEFTNTAVSIEHLDAKINTNKTEFAPIPFNDNVLYFSSTISGVAKIYRAQKKGDQWSRPQTPNIFVGKTKKPHFGNGSFTTDGKRFYFTQCDLENGKASCAIYLMTETKDGWSDPVLLPPYINSEGANTTHPFVVNQGGKEILYFVSDREGGRGGLDLWFCTKNASGTSDNYTLPKNLGRNINTPGDEITPFYDKTEGILYFSSTGRVSAGGLDVFKSKGEKLQWEVAQNLGFPINSSADDLYYTTAPSHGGGYFVSNRMLAPQKVATTDDDVFYYGEQKIVITVEGAITDADDPDAGPLADVNVRLFLDDEMVDDRMITDGQYRFRLKKKGQYTLEFAKEDYKIATFDVSTVDADFSEEITKDVGLEKPKADVVVAAPKEEDIKYKIVPAEYNSKENPYIMPESPVDPLTGEEYTGKELELYNDIMENVASESPQGMVYYDGDGGALVPYIPNEDVVVANPEPTLDVEPEKTDEVYKPTKTEEGVMYRIQVAAVRKYKPYKYEKLDDIGKQHFETIDGGLRRVMVIPDEKTEDGLEGYATASDALNKLSYIINNTRFTSAFVIKYVDGERVGEGFRGLDEAEETLGDDASEESPESEDYEGF